MPSSSDDDDEQPVVRKVSPFFPLPIISCSTCSTSHQEKPSAKPRREPKSPATVPDSSDEEEDHSNKPVVKKVCLFYIFLFNIHTEHCTRQ